jgi:putative FmdB family regulatory protein
LPIYEYRCQQCGHELDALQKISEDPLTECPECGQSSLTKLVSAPNFRLKGSGWYETDFKKDNKRNLADDPKADAPKTADKSDGGKDATKKPAKEGAATPAPKSTKAKSSGDGGKAA